MPAAFLVRAHTKELLTVVLAVQVARGLLPARAGATTAYASPE